MKRQIFTALFLAGIVFTFFSGCTSINHSMREPNARMQWEKADFTYSEQVSGEATTTRIFMIDWARLFTKKAGSVQGSGGGALPFALGDIPVIGSFVGDRTVNYALYDMMEKNPGYDVVFYPKYETKVVSPIGLSFIVNTTKVKATARLAKIK